MYSFSVKAEPAVKVKAVFESADAGMALNIRLGETADKLCISLLDARGNQVISLRPSKPLYMSYLPTFLDTPNLACLQISALVIFVQVPFPAKMNESSLRELCSFKLLGEVAATGKRARGAGPSSSSGKAELQVSSQGLTMPELAEYFMSAYWHIFLLLKAVFSVRYELYNK